MPTTITGSVRDLTGTAQTSGVFVRFTLQGTGGQQPRVSGTAVIVPEVEDFDPDASGTISGTLYSTRDASGNGNGEIEVGGSLTSVWYKMEVFVNGRPQARLGVHAKNGATLDISNVSAITTTPVATAPTGDTTYARLDGGNMPFTGQVVGKNGTSASPGFAFASDLQTGFLRQAAGVIGGVIVGAFKWLLSATGILIGANESLGYSSNNDPTQAAGDTFISRQSAGVLGVGTSSSNALGGLNVATILSKTFNNVVLVDNANTFGWSGSNAGAWIASAIAALPSTGGVVDATGLGANVHTISAQLDIGSSTKPVSLLINPATRFQITTISSSTTDAIRLFNGCHIEGIGAGGVGANGDQANFTVQSGCTVRSIIANGTQDGTQEFCSVCNVTLRSNTGSTVSKGLLYLTGIFAGSYFRDIYTVFNGGGGSALYLTAPTGATLNVTSDVQFYNCTFDGGGATGGGPAVTITPLGTGSQISSINFTNCQIQHAGNNQPELKIDGAGSALVGDIAFFGLHLESSTGLTTTGPYVSLNDCHGITFKGVNTSGANPTAGNGITLAQATANSVYNIKIEGWHQPGAITNIVSSTVTGIATLAFVAGVDSTMYIDNWTGLAQNFLVGGQIKSKRYSATLGTALTTGDFSLTGNWGTGSSIASVDGTDQGFSITINLGASPGALPGFTLTYKDGTWTNAPKVIASVTGVTGAGVFGSSLVSTTATVLTYVFNGTPGASGTTTITCLLMGK